MNYSEIILPQHLAAVEMLKQAVIECPSEMWDAPTDTPKFWHIAYHALFYTHLYIQPTEQTFVPWSQHRPEYQFMGQTPWPPHAPPQIGAPYTPAEVLEYVTVCQQAVIECMPQLNWDGPSGFSWLPFGKLELQFYILRHLHQHVGELMERLGTRANIHIHWVVRRLPEAGY